MHTSTYAFIMPTADRGCFFFFTRRDRSAGLWPDLHALLESTWRVELGPARVNPQQTARVMLLCVCILEEGTIRARLLFFKNRLFFSETAMIDDDFLRQHQAYSSSSRHKGISFLNTPYTAVPPLLLLLSPRTDPRVNIIVHTPAQEQHDGMP